MMAKFNIGDIVVPTTDDCNIIRKSNDCVCKVLSHINKHGLIEVEIISINKKDIGFLGRTFPVFEESFALKSEENNKNQKEKSKMKTESTTINATPNALQSVIDLIGKYSIKKDGTESTPQEIIAVQIYVAKDGLKSQRAYRSVDAYVNIEDLVIFDLPQLKFVPHTDTETVDDKIEEDVDFTIDDIIAEEKVVKPVNDYDDVNWDRFAGKYRTLTKEDAKALYEIYKSGRYTSKYIAYKLGLKNVGVLTSKMYKIKKEYGL